MREVGKLAWKLVPRNTSGPVGVEDLLDATDSGESESDDTDDAMEELMRNMERMRP